MDQHTRHLHLTVMEARSHVNNWFEIYNKCSHVQSYFKNSYKGRELKSVVVPGSTETAPDTPKSNRFSESFNRILLDPVRVLLEHSCLPKIISNILLTSFLMLKSLKMTLFEALKGNSTSIKNIEVFRCATFLLDSNPKSIFHAM